MTDIKDCLHCQRLLIEPLSAIAGAGEGSALFIELPEDDLQALSNLSNAP
jgi:hypothetical protein